MTSIDLRRSAVILMAATVAGYALSFGKEIVVAWLFGAGREMDAYYAALTLPGFVASLLGFSATAVIVPAYVTWKVQRPELAPGLVRLTVRDIPLGLAALSALMALGAGPLIRTFFPGLPPDVSARAIELERLMAWSAAALGSTALLTGFLNAEGAFVGPSLSSAFVTFATLGAIALLWRRGSTALAAGLVVGTLSQTLWLAWRWRGTPAPTGGRNVSWRDPEVRAMLPFLAAIVGSFGMNEINTLVDRLMASMLPPGSIASLGYAIKLYSVPQQILCMPIVAVAYPMLAQRIAERDEARLEADFRKACRLGFALMLPVTAFLMRYAGLIIVAVFERGRFDPAATLLVARTLSCLSLSIPALVPIFLISRLAMLDRDARVILTFGVLAVVMNAGLDWVLMRVWTPPVAGIALSTSVTMMTALLAFTLALSRTHRWLRVGSFLADARPYLLPTAAMLAASEAGFRLMAWSGALPRLAVAGLFGAAALAATAHALKLDEMVSGFAFLKGRFGAPPAA